MFGTLPVWQESGKALGLCPTFTRSEEAAETSARIFRAERGPVFLGQCGQARSKNRIWGVMTSSLYDLGYADSECTPLSNGRQQGNIKEYRFNRPELLGCELSRQEVPKIPVETEVGRPWHSLARHET